MDFYVLEIEDIIGSFFLEIIPLHLVNHLEYQSDLEIGVNWFIPKRINKQS